MKNREKKPAGSLFAEKVLEEKEERKLDFIVDLIIAGFIFYIIRSVLTGLWSVIE